MGGDVLRYQNSSKEFPEQNTSMYASAASGGNVTCVTAPTSFSMLKKSAVIGDRLDRGMIISAGLGLKKLGVGA